ncbi:hypothetical protein H5410_045485 [Solanum commersonii]|uniref:Uncharacterized protein n=1 Tax=Solanum commersonii TaxID=4109 RepID=A0A9J5X9Q8_SOLCO|nr:hypothetical protein H5410_045485 [Solanum commersonii]
MNLPQSVNIIIQNRLLNHHSNHYQCVTIDHLMKSYLADDVNAEISDESSEEDEPSKDDNESQSDEDINDIIYFSQYDIGDKSSLYEREVSKV